MTNHPGVQDLYVGQHLALKTDGSWEFAERPTSGCVAILAQTDAGELLLVEQYRPPVRRRVIALPAGLAGDVAGSEKEALAEAAQRELEEETGHGATGMKLLFEGPSSPGLTSELMSIFRAEGVQKIEGRELDAEEGITLHIVPMNGLIPWLRARESEGCLIDYKIYAALYVANLAS